MSTTTDAQSQPALFGNDGPRSRPSLARITTLPPLRVDTLEKDVDGASQVQSEWPMSPAEGSTYTTAIVKGAGPSGLAAAISLVDAGFDPSHILVVERRVHRPEGQGRKNMVAIRPEGLRRLHELECLDYAREKGWITDLKDGQTFNEWNVHLEGAGIFEWPIARYDSGMKVVSDNPSSHESALREGHNKNDGKPDEEDWVKIEEGIDYDHADDENVIENGRKTPKAYKPPARINEQVPCCFINLGHLEDALLHTALRKNIHIRYDSSVELHPEDQDGADTADGDQVRYRAVLLDNILGSSTRPASLELSRFDFGCPDLIVCASGKGDSALSGELGFKRLIGPKLEDEHVPSPGRRALKISQEHEMETQMFSVFGVQTPDREMGRLYHIVRKQNTGQPEQPVTEIEMRHASATHCLFQLPRGLETKDLDDYLTQRVNKKLGTNFSSVQHMRDEHALVWGDPLSPILVETATAPQYAFGSNVILIGDAAMSCSPASGLGADIGMTVDSRDVYELGLAVVQSKATQLQNKDAAINERQQALESFSRKKAQSAVIWSQGSRWFYITSKEAREILTKKGLTEKAQATHANLLSGDW